MPIDLYYTPGSPPCRLVSLVGAAVNVEFNRIEVNLRAKENLKPEYLKINPQHTVPTIVDHGFSLWESRAISRYLVNKYSSGGPLYPTEPKQRALIDHRMDFDLGTLCPSFAQYFYPQLFRGVQPTTAQMNKLQDSLSCLDTMLEGMEYSVPGNELTIADLCLVTTVSTIDAAGISLEKYHNIQSWFALVKATAPNYHEANEKGLEDFKVLIREVLMNKKMKEKAEKEQSSSRHSLPGTSSVTSYS